MKQEEKVLTRVLVEELGLDKLEVITSDMIDGYTSIGKYAFRGCRGLTSITIPNSVTSIGKDAFSGCRGLTSVTIGNSVTSIGDWTFDDCSGLTSVTIPNSVTSIGNDAFSGCSRLTSITIPNSVTSVGCGAFKDCRGLTSIVVESGNTTYDSRNGCNAIIETATNTLVVGCQATIIPNSVTSIGSCAFYNCSGLTSITIPNSVTSIERFAFDICNNLKSVIIGNTTYETQEVVEGKCKAYKVFNSNMICHYFQYEEGKTYEIFGEPELCYRGFHACLSLTDVFSYYYGDLGKEIVVHEVELEGVSDERDEDNSKVVAKKIKIGKRIL